MINFVLDKICIDKFCCDKFSDDKLCSWSERERVHIGSKEITKFDVFWNLYTWTLQVIGDVGGRLGGGEI